ncbi:MAG: hypothetical protein WCC13_05320 [Methylovirgula sp.]
MAIYRLLENSPLGPEEIRRMTEAYEIALRTLKIPNRAGPLTELVAKKIIAIAQTGKEDSEALANRALKEVGIPIPK